MLIKQSHFHEEYLAENDYEEKIPLSMSAFKTEEKRISEFIFVLKLEKVLEISSVCDY